MEHSGGTTLTNKEQKKKYQVSHSQYSDITSLIQILLLFATSHKYAVSMHYICIAYPHRAPDQRGGRNIKLP